jgi:hypothetical protein
MSAFRTATGQTGRDAYIFEASAIANSLRDLNECMARLSAAMLDELPANDWMRPALESAGDCATLAPMLRNALLKRSAPPRP